MNVTDTITELSESIRIAERRILDRLQGIQNARLDADAKLQQQIDSASGPPTAKEIANLRDEKWSILESHQAALEGLQESLTAAVTDGEQTVSAIRQQVHERLTVEASELQSNLKLTTELSIIRARQSPIMTALFQEQLRAERRLSNLNAKLSEIETLIDGVKREMSSASKRWRSVL